MSKKTEEKEVKLGRPKKEVNWQKVEELLIAGCSGTEIAAYIGIDRRTLYEKCVEEFNINFSDYSAIFYSKGDALLRAHKYAKAMGHTDKGDNTLLIWLGKTRLKMEREEKIFEAELKAKTFEKQAEDAIKMAEATVKSLAELQESHKAAMKLLDQAERKAESEHSLDQRE